MMNKLEVRLRRRTEVGEDLALLNRRIVDGLCGVAGLWKSGQNIDCAQFDIGDGESAATDLSSCLLPGFVGAVSYASREVLAVVDKAIADDTLVLQVELDSIDFEWLARSLFPSVVSIFGAYRGCIVTDIDQDLDNFELVVQEAQITGLDVDGRDTVFRFCAVNYFDATLCKRAFGCRPDVLADKLKDSVYLVEPFLEGVMIMLAGQPVSGPPLIDLDVSARRVLQPV